MIDAHHHFWRYDADEYSWIDDSMRAIRRNFLPDDLRESTKAAGIDGVVSVQARQSLEETRWLLDLAAANDFIRGVIGWVPLCDPGLADVLARFAESQKLKGVRHVIQAEPDGFMLGDAFNRGIAALAPRDLAYDILVVERQLPEVLAFVDRHPNQRFVLDHVAKPRIRECVLEPWKSNIRELARRGNVACKLSGMVTEADFSAWTPQQLAPYIETVLDAFGPGRTMFGSDWPVCLVACDYRRWVDIVRAAISQLTQEEQSAVMGGTASDWYVLGSPCDLT